MLIVPLRKCFAVKMWTCLDGSLLVHGAGCWLDIIYRSKYASNLVPSPTGELTGGIVALQGCPSQVCNSGYYTQLLSKKCWFFFIFFFLHFLKVRLATFTSITVLFFQLSLTHMIWFCSLLAGDCYTHQLWMDLWYYCVSLTGRAMIIGIVSIVWINQTRYSIQTFWARGFMTATRGD